MDAQGSLKQVNEGRVRTDSYTQPWRCVLPLNPFSEIMIRPLGEL